ncbi:hypothetical protein GCK32_000454 [Trichostrongylus colubriformis]|uniref:Uncharacterized protein n=1 Tax=Trichostrongylus colubriformis TaxID=6319 RepID=A0AAN8END1_TRICO
MTPEDRHALNVLETKIAAMERKLRNAKAARDSYVRLLNEKYPDWRTSSTSVKGLYAPKETMVNRLLTSEYNWDEERDRRERFVPRYRPLPLYEDIPPNGPLLSSDMERIRRRLTEISKQLRIIKEDRLNITTEDYLRRKVEIEAEGYDKNASLAAIRSRLSDISLAKVEPVTTPTSEQILFMKFDEERDKYMADIRDGRVAPSSIVPAPQFVTLTSTAAPATIVESPQPAVHQPDKPDLPGNKPTAVLRSDKQSSPSEGRTTTSQDQIPQQSQAQVQTKEQSASAAQQSSVYQKMKGLFGNTNTSDTDDDISVQANPTANTSKQPLPVSMPPVVRQSSASMLSQYLATANSNNKDATSSDSDDDFFK